MQPFAAAVRELVSLEMWLSADIGFAHPQHAPLHQLLRDLRSQLQHASRDPRGDAADAALASRQLRSINALRSLLPDLEPRPVDLLDAVDRLDRICSHLIAAGGRP
jgi:hypothetical protein